jgi:hypothetical protein
VRSKVGPPVRLVGRRDECAQLDALIAGARGGVSGALVVRGTPGIGKTALLDYPLATAAGCRIVRAGSVESEMELAYSGRHQLCASLFDHLEHLPDRSGRPARGGSAADISRVAARPPDRIGSIRSQTRVTTSRIHGRDQCLPESP